MKNANICVQRYYLCHDLLLKRNHIHEKLKWDSLFLEPAVEYATYSMVKEVSVPFSVMIFRFMVSLAALTVCET